MITMSIFYKRLVVYRSSFQVSSNIVKESQIFFVIDSLNKLLQNKIRWVGYEIFILAAVEN